MQPSGIFTHTLLALMVFVIFASPALAAEPGLPFPNTSEVSDQKAGSALFYNYYTSNAVSPDRENTEISITNTHLTSPVVVRLFFVDSSTCKPDSADICLTSNTTVTFLASDIDPGVTGYILAVAISSMGCPISFNHLIGGVYTKSGFYTSRANLSAEAIAAVFSSLDGAPAPSCNPTQAVISFDGVNYNRVPRVLALDNIASQGDFNITTLIVNRVGGDFTKFAAGNLDSVSGLLFDDDKVKAVSFTFFGFCQYSSDVSSLVPSLYTKIPAGHTGWMKFRTDDDHGIFGAVIRSLVVLRAGPVTSSPREFLGSHNLHKLTLQNPTSSSGFDRYTIPVFPPSC